MIALLSLLGSSPVLAATWTVDAGGGGDFSTLSAAVAAAASGDELTVAAGTYADECLDFAGKDLTITGDDSGSPKLVTGASTCDNLLALDEGEEVSITGLSLQNSESRVAYVANAGNLALTEVTVSGSGNWNSWAGTLYVTSGTLTVTDSTLSGNTGSYGGTIYAYASTVTLTGTEISGANGWYGAVAYLDGYNAFTLEDCTVSGNWTYYSGNIRAVAGDTITLLDSTFSGNTLYQGSGGVLSVDWSYGVTIRDSTFTSNQATYSGGVASFYANQSTIEITDSVFEGNVASYYYGGAIHSEWYPSFQISGSTFKDNRSYYEGGAMSAWYDTRLDIEDTVFDGNIASYSKGGAVSFYDGDQSHGMSVSDSTFVQNTAYTEGGALDLTWVDDITITGSVFEANNAGNDSTGGALDVYVANDITLHGNTFCLNEAGTGGAVNEQWVYVSDEWTNNLFVENTASYGGARARYASYVGEVVNNTFVGNRALVYGGAWYANYDYADFRNNVVANTPSGNGLYAIEPYSGANSSLAFDAWDSNAAIDAGGYFSATDDGSGHVWGTEEDGLLFQDYSFDGNCGNDDLRPAPGSVLTDAGDPDLEDPDGSRSDIGAYGGPDALVMDWDGDGVDTLTDCDDGDAAVFPGAEERCNGIDDDCDGEIDVGATNADTVYTDADGDGFGDPDSPVSTCEEDLSGTVTNHSDCDDADPTVFPMATELADDGIDQDCDGEDLVTDTPEDTDDDQDAMDDLDSSTGSESSSGCSCGNPLRTQRRAGLLLILLPLLVLRRRRD